MFRVDLDFDHFLDRLYAVKPCLFPGTGFVGERSKKVDAVILRDALQREEGHFF